MTINTDLMPESEAALMIGEAVVRQEFVSPGPRGPRPARPLVGSRGPGCDRGAIGNFVCHIPATGGRGFLLGFGGRHAWIAWLDLVAGGDEDGDRGTEA